MTNQAGWYAGCLICHFECCEGSTGYIFSYFFGVLFFGLCQVVIH